VKTLFDQKRHALRGGLVLMLCLALLLSPPASAFAQTSWQKKWDAVLADAKMEGTVVVAASSLGTDTRPELMEAFVKRFGFQLEVLGISGAEMVARVEREATAGRITIDVMLSGADDLLSLLPAGRLDPIKPKLILPEVLDVVKWRNKTLKFNDPEGKYFLQTSEYLPSDLVINTSMVKPGSITSWKDLLKPEYKGKIASFDSRRAGPGLSTASYLLPKFGPGFIKALYLGQQVSYTSDPRQLAEWIARGVYPIGLAVGSRQIEPLRALGQPIERIFPKDGPGYLSGGPSVMKLVKNAPHPNGAVVFSNWFLTKEPQEIYQRTVATVSRRADVDLAGIPDYVIPKQGVEYLDTYTYAYIKDTRPKLQKLLGEILGR
jgi:ABC-type Fe3+ transport system substrate-binding protein